MVARLHTLAAVRVIMAQSDGAGNECSEDVNQSSLTASLVRELERAPMVGDGSAFIRGSRGSSTAAAADVRLAANSRFDGCTGRNRSIGTKCDERL